MSLARIEARLRRIARTMGFLIQKSRRRNPNAADYQGYFIYDGWTNTVIRGDSPFTYSLDIDDVAAVLEEYRQAGWADDPARAL